MLDVVERNKRLYTAMIETLNSFYFDNGISPNETAAKLEEFAAEAARLAKFIRDNDPSLDPRSPTLRAVVTPDTQADYGWDGTTHYEQTMPIVDEDEIE